MLLVHVRNRSVLNIPRSFEWRLRPTTRSAGWVMQRTGHRASPIGTGGTQGYAQKAPSLEKNGRYLRGTCCLPCWNCHLRKCNPNLNFPMGYEEYALCRLGSTIVELLTLILSLTQQQERSGGNPPALDCSRPGADVRPFGTTVGSLPQAALYTPGRRFLTISPVGQSTCGSASDPTNEVLNYGGKII